MSASNSCWERARGGGIFKCERQCRLWWLLQKWGLPPFFTSAIACSHEAGFVGEHEGHLFSDCVALSGVLADRFVSREACWQRGKHVDNLLGQAVRIKRKGFEALVFRMQQELEAPSWVLEKLIAKTNQIYAIRLLAHAWSIFM